MEAAGESPPGTLVPEDIGGRGGGEPRNHSREAKQPRLPRSTTGSGSSGAGEAQGRSEDWGREVREGGAATKGCGVRGAGGERGERLLEELKPRPSGAPTPAATGGQRSPPRPPPPPRPRIQLQPAGSGASPSSSSSSAASSSGRGGGQRGEAVRSRGAGVGEAPVGVTAGRGGRGAVSVSHRLPGERPGNRRAPPAGLRG